MLVARTENLVEDLRKLLLDNIPNGYYDKDKWIDILKTIMMIFVGIAIVAIMMWIVTLALVATGS